MLRQLLDSVASPGCHATGGDRAGGDRGTIALVGSPNVGKSVLFNRLTGTYVTVSNYPGTTVEISRGTAAIAGERYGVVDTPGMYSLLPLSEDERVARSILLQEEPEVVVHVADASNLERMLPLTRQLLEAGLPVVLVLNMMDEAEAAGLTVDAEQLQAELGVPVIKAVATSGRGLQELRRAVADGVDSVSADRLRPSTPAGRRVADAADRIAELIRASYGISRRATALLLLQGDEEARDLVARSEPGALEPIEEIAKEVRDALSRPVDYVLALERGLWASALVSRCVGRGEPSGTGIGEKLSDLMTHPLTGLPILALVLYFGLYRLVGVFGAGTVVDFLEGTVFEELINPHVDAAVGRVIPWPALRDLVAGDYGVITLGLRYAVAIILPIVGLFFLVFAFLEDVGYLPRLALLLDRVFKKLGLSGRAVIPMVLGFGCDTMATMVTRTLSTSRERLIAIILLSVAVPCSAQLGVIMALLSDVPGGLLIWAGVVLCIYLLTGLLAARLLPGRPAPFYVEVPPLRWPRVGNILSKTFARVKWYFKEVLPLFILASVLIWLGKLTGVFGLAIRLLEHPVRWIGLPPQSAQAFLFGFFRRDYGVAGLYDVESAGLLSGVQLVVAAVTLTLFVPCIAHYLMTVRAKGWKWAGAIAVCTIAVAFVTGLVLNLTLSGLGVTL